MAAEIEINTQFELVKEDPTIDDQDLTPLGEELAAEIEQNMKDYQPEQTDELELQNRQKKKRKRKEKVA